MRRFRRSSNPTRKTPGFTIVEVLVILAILVLGLIVILPALEKPRGCGTRTLKDATQIRNITQALITFANTNQDRYPLPSQLDKDNQTIAAAAGNPDQKDTTGDILSILVYSGSVSTELCISPAEANTAQIVKDEKYEFSAPSAAATPDNALWDPGFAGTPIDSARRRGLDGQFGSGERVGHQSYAHIPTRGGRLPRWSNSFNATEAVWGNRGPEFVETTSVSTRRYTLAPGATGTRSNTLLIHGGRNTWEGYIGYNDGHVAFETSGGSEGVTFRRGAGKTAANVPDNPFIDEADETDAFGTPRAAFDRVNNFLRPVAAVPPASGAPMTQGMTPGHHLWVD